MSEPTTVPATEIVDAAERLRAATTSGVPVPPVRDLIGSRDVGAAYAVQQLVNADRVGAGARVVGRKVGLTSDAIQQQLGIDQPDFGTLFDDMAYTSGALVQYGSVLQPRVEAEVAFVLASDLADDDLGRLKVREAIGAVVPALEICGSRIVRWDISFADTVADNASAGAYVLGAAERTLDDIDPRDAEMTMSIDGEVVSTGSGADCLGDPVEAVVWLARQARKLGDPLRAGEVVLSGALGPMRSVHPDSEVSADISGLGQISVRFTP